MRRSSINPISDKKRQQLAKEKALVARLFVKQKGLCAKCGRPLGWASAKHEIKFRSRGGDPTDENNTILLCLLCHLKAHDIIVK